MCEEFRLNVMRWKTGIRIQRTGDGWGQVEDDICRQRKVWRLVRCQPDEHGDMTLRVHLKRHDAKRIPAVALWYSSAHERDAQAACVPDRHFDFATRTKDGVEAVVWNGYDPESGKGPYAVFVLDPEYPSDVVDGVGWVWGTKHEKPELWFELQDVENPGDEHSEGDEEDSSPIPVPGKRTIRVRIEGELVVRVLPEGSLQE